MQIHRLVIAFATNTMSLVVTDDDGADHNLHLDPGDMGAPPDFADQMARDLAKGAAGYIARSKVEARVARIEQIRAEAATHQPRTQTHTDLVAYLATLEAEHAAIEAERLKAVEAEKEEALKSI